MLLTGIINHTVTITNNMSAWHNIILWVDQITVAFWACTPSWVLSAYNMPTCCPLEDFFFFAASLHNICTWLMNYINFILVCNLPTETEGSSVIEAGGEGGSGPPSLSVSERGLQSVSVTGTWGRSPLLLSRGVVTVVVMVEGMVVPTGSTDINVTVGKQ